MSDETDRLADLGVDEETSFCLSENDAPKVQGERKPRVIRSQKDKNRERMRRKRQDPAYRDAERKKNRERMRRLRRHLTNPYSGARVPL